MDLTTWWRQIWSHAWSSFLTLCSSHALDSPPIFEEVCLISINLWEEVLKTVDLRLVLYLPESLTFLLGNSHFQFSQTLRAIDWATEHFFLCIHQIIVVEIDCFCSSLCIEQVSLILLLLHLLVFQSRIVDDFSFVWVCALVMKCLIRTYYSLLAILLLFGNLGRFKSSFQLSFWPSSLLLGWFHNYFLVNEIWEC